MAILLKKMTIFVNLFLKKMSSFWQLFDIQLAIFRRVSLGATLTSVTLVDTHNTLDLGIRLGGRMMGCD